jgi:hypothetical protein
VLYVCDKRLKFGAPTVVPQGEEAQEDDRQHIPLVIRRLHRPAKRNRGLEQLLCQPDNPAVLAVARFFGFLLPRSALRHVQYLC